MSKANPLCPFCKGVISRDLERFGGNCPHCLLEVPGDDAPTNPGIELQERLEAKQQEVEIQQQRKSRWLVGAGVLAGLLVVGVSGGLSYKAWEDRQYIPPGYYEFPLEELSAAPEPEAINPADYPAEASRGPKTTRTTSQPTRTVSQTPNSPVVDQMPELPSYGLTTVVDLPGETKTNRGSGEVLTEDAAIRDMAARVLKTYSPQIQACYGRVVKQIPDLRGAWTVTFTIQPDGSTQNIQVHNAGTANAELESCMSRSVGTWRFQQIAAPFKVAKRYGLSPSE